MVRYSLSIIALSLCVGTLSTPVYSETNYADWTRTKPRAAIVESAEPIPQKTTAKQSTIAVKNHAPQVKTPTRVPAIQPPKSPPNKQTMPNIAPQHAPAIPQPVQVNSSDSDPKQIAIERKISDVSRTLKEPAKTAFYNWAHSLSLMAVLSNDGINVFDGTYDIFIKQYNASVGCINSLGFANLAHTTSAIISTLNGAHGRNNVQRVLGNSKTYKLGSSQTNKC